nr:sensor histidine kinase [Cellulomonas sp. APG4]
MAQVSIALAFAVLLGLWVTQVAEQGELRAQLLEELEATQAELGRSHHAAGVAAERERLAREIHDTLAQGFTSVVMLAQATAADVRRGAAERAEERLALIERTARDNLAEARALVAAFSPVELQSGGLTEALGRLAGRFERETGVEVDVVLAAELPGLDRDAEVILLRAAQEALSNVRRHAAAAHVRLVLDGGDQTRGQGTEGDDVSTSPTHAVALEVVDDGRGFDPSTTAGLGLQGMRERVTSGGGELDVTSSPDGTRVRVLVPTRPSTAPPDGATAPPGGAA